MYNSRKCSFFFHILSCSRRACSMAGREEWGEWTQSQRWAWPCKQLLRLHNRPIFVALTFSFFYSVLYNVRAEWTWRSWPGQNPNLNLTHHYLSEKSNMVLMGSALKFKRHFKPFNASSLHRCQHCISSYRNLHTTSQGKQRRRYTVFFGFATEITKIEEYF
jgi:hypothetical protein